MYTQDTRQLLHSSKQQAAKTKTNTADNGLKELLKDQ